MEFNNEYLNKRLSEIILKNNFFDMILELKEFEKEYKQSDFYKKTKLNLIDLLKDARIFYITNTDVLINRFNAIIEGLTSEKLVAILEQANTTLETNNNITLEQLKEFKDLGGMDIIDNHFTLEGQEEE